MPRKITVTFEDGTSHIYEGVPEEVTPEQVQERAAKDFSGLHPVSIDRGALEAPAQPTQKPFKDEDFPEYTKLLRDKRTTPEALASWLKDKGYGDATNAADLLSYHQKNPQVEPTNTYKSRVGPVQDTPSPNGLPQPGTPTDFLPDFIQKPVENAGLALGLIDPNTYYGLGDYGANAKAPDRGASVSQAPAPGFVDRMGRAAVENAGRAGGSLLSVLGRASDTVSDDDAIRHYGSMHNWTGQQIDDAIAYAHNQRAAEVTHEREQRAARDLAEANKEDGGSPTLLGKLKRGTADILGGSVADGPLLFAAPEIKGAEAAAPFVGKAVGLLSPKLAPASEELAARLLPAMAGQGAVQSGADIVSQTSEIQGGTKESFDPVETLIRGSLGVAVPVAGAAIKPLVKGAADLVSGGVGKVTTKLGDATSVLTDKFGKIVAKTYDRLGKEAADLSETYAQHGNPEAAAAARATSEKYFEKARQATTNGIEGLPDTVRPRHIRDATEALSKLKVDADNFQGTTNPNPEDVFKRELTPQELEAKLAAEAAQFQSGRTPEPAPEAQPDPHVQDIAPAKAPDTAAEDEAILRQHGLTPGHFNSPEEITQAVSLLRGRPPVEPTSYEGPVTSDVPIDAPTLSKKEANAQFDEISTDPNAKKQTPSQWGKSLEEQAAEWKAAKESGTTEAEPSPAAKNATAEAPPAETPSAPFKAPPLMPGMVRVYHGGSADGPGEWVTTSKDYADQHASKSHKPTTYYVDVPENDPRFSNQDYPDQGVKQGFTFNGKLTAEEISRMRPVGENTSSTGSPKTGPSSDEDVIDRLTKALSNAGRVMPEQEALYSKARSERLAAAREALKTGGVAGYRKAMATLQGELPKADFSPVAGQFSAEDMDTLVNHIVNSPNLRGYEPISTIQALDKLVNGKLPAPAELDKLSKVFSPDFVKAVIKHRSAAQKSGGLFNQIWNLPRSLVSTLDASIPLRQGVFMVSRPEFYTSFGKMIRQMGSEKYFEATQAALRERPTFGLMEESGLAIHDNKSLDIGARPEQFRSNWAGKIPVFKHLYNISERGAEGFSNQLRADVFDRMYTQYKRVGINLEDQPALAKKVADYINTATGRGKVPFDKVGTTVGDIFFSPQLMSSRIQLVTLPGRILLEKDPVLRNNMIRDLTGFAAIASTVIALAKLNGADINDNPLSTDWGKIKIDAKGGVSGALAQTPALAGVGVQTFKGQTRYDIFGGMQQYVHLAAVLAMNERETINGKTIQFGKGYKPETRASTIERFLRSKESPAASFIHDALEGSDYMGNKFELQKELTSRLIPFSAQDIATGYDPSSTDTKKAQ